MQSSHPNFDFPEPAGIVTASVNSPSGATPPPAKGISWRDVAALAFLSLALICSNRNLRTFSKLRYLPSLNTTFRTQIRLPLDWAPPTFRPEDLSFCWRLTGHGLCPVLSQLEQRSGSPARAWEEFSHFFLGQLSVAEDARTQGFLCAILDIAYAFYHHNHGFPRRSPRSLTEQEFGWRTERFSIRARYPWLGGGGAESVYNHHGLRWVPNTVKDYIRERDIIDVGASVGDSLAVFEDYTNRRVISYELVPETAKRAQDSANHLKPEKHVIVASGLSTAIGTTRVTQGPRFGRKEEVEVQITTIDLEAKRLNLTVGVIKADVEGVEPEVLLGAIETIRRDRPVIACAIYHSLEFLELPKMLLPLGYRLRFGFGQYEWHGHWEMTCVGIPDFLPKEGESGCANCRDPRCAQFG
jgi:FkbM family methyltransferase